MSLSRLGWFLVVAGALMWSAGVVFGCPDCPCGPSACKCSPCDCGPCAMRSFLAGPAARQCAMRACLETPPAGPPAAPLPRPRELPRPQGLQRVPPRSAAPQGPTILRPFRQFQSPGCLPGG